MRMPNRFLLPLVLAFGASSPAWAQCNVALESVLSNGQAVLKANCGAVAVTEISWKRDDQLAVSVPFTFPAVNNLDIFYTVPLAVGTHNYTATANAGTVAAGNSATITYPGLALTVAATAGGEVDSAPAGIIDCTSAGGTCSANFAPGTAVTLTATPTSGFTLSGWGGDCSGTATTCVVSMSSPRTVIANFGNQPSNGACGSASSSTAVTTAPTANLCSSGTPTGVATPTASPWNFTWGCNGANGGTSTAPTACSVPYQFSGVCGAMHNGAPQSSTPTTNLCNPGTASAVTATTVSPFVFQWTCSGANGGTPSGQCQVAQLSTPGACGTANGGNTLNAPAGTAACSTGTPAGMNSPAPGGTFTWTCDGLAGGAASPQCSANQTVNGACGTANGVAVSAAPTSGLCVAGSNATAVAGTGPWTWGCNGVNGGTSTAPAACSAPVGSSCNTGAGETFTPSDFFWNPVSTTTLYPIPPATGSGDLGRAIKFVANGTMYPNGIILRVVDETANALNKEVVLSSCPHNFSPYGGSVYCRLQGTSGVSRNLYYYSAANGKTTPGAYDCVLQEGSEYYINFRHNTTGTRGTVSSQFGASAR